MMRTERNGLAIMRAADRRKERQENTREGRLERARFQVDAVRKQTLGRAEGAIKTCRELGFPLPLDAQEEMTRKAREEFQERVDSISQTWGFTFSELGAW